MLMFPCDGAIHRNEIALAVWLPYLDAGAKKGVEERHQ
jgi:hypothetical protein